MRKTFADARAYQSIKVADVDVGCSPTRLPDFKKAYVDDGSKVVNPDARMSWSDKGLSLSVVSPAPYKLGKDIWDSDSFELFVAPGDDKPVNLYQFGLFVLMVPDAAFINLRLLCNRNFVGSDKLKTRDNTHCQRITLCN